MLWISRRYGFIWKAFTMAFHSRRFGPAINERSQFANRTIMAVRPQEWPQAPFYNKITLPDERLQFHDQLGTVAFLVMQNNHLVFERYWSGFDETSRINSFSVAKSVISILIGILIKEGKLHLDDTITSLLPFLADTGKDRITVRNLLMMSSGLEWIESEVHPFSHNAKAYYGRDLPQLIKDLRSKRPPGEVYRYVSGNTQILAMIIQEVSGITVSEFTEQALWSKLGCEYDAYWNLDRPSGLEKAFCCLYATPRDFGRIGQLYLQHGQWEGEQIVSKQFVQDSLTPSGLLDVWRNRTNDHYGWHWWLASHGGLSFFYARGIRGQYIICQPDLDLVIVRMGQKRNPVDRRTGHPPDLFDHIDAGLEIIRSNPAIAPA